MLNFFRSHTKTVAWIVVLSFLLWGAFSVTASLGKEGRFAGEVFGKTVSFQEFSQYYRGSQIFSFGQDLPDDPDVLRQVTWQNLIYAREARRKNYKVSDDEVHEELMRLMANQGLAQADSSAYQGWVRSVLKMEPHQFENQLREVIRVQKMLKEVSRISMEAPNDTEIENFNLLENSRIALQAAAFPTVKDAEDFLKKVRNPASWDAETAKIPDQVMSLPEASLAETVQGLRMDSAMALELQKLPAGGISEPIPLGGKIVIFRVTDKKEVPNRPLTPSEKEALAEKVRDKKKQLYFMSWHLNLMKQAGLRDFTAGSSNSTA